MIPLTKTETKLLLDAAARGGALLFPDTTKPISRDRTLGKLEAEGLIAAGGEGGGEPQLTPAGYRAVGLKPPRRKRVFEVAVAETAVSGVAEAQAGADVPRAGTKRALVAEMLGRQGGASLAELMAATGWLPHTTRAALSRIRSAGQPLAKTKRPDGSTGYRADAPFSAAA